MHYTKTLIRLSTGSVSPFEDSLTKLQLVNNHSLITFSADVTQSSLSVRAGSLYLMHGVEQLGELIETLPVLAGVLLTLYNGFPQLFDVRHPKLVEHRLALQAVLWH